MGAVGNTIGLDELFAVVVNELFEIMSCTGVFTGDNVLVCGCDQVHVRLGQELKCENK